MYIFLELRFHSGLALLHLPPLNFGLVASDFTNYLIYGSTDFVANGGVACRMFISFVFLYIWR